MKETASAAYQSLACFSLARHADRHLAWLCRNATVLVPHTPNAVGDISSQIRNGFLQGQAMAPSSIQMDR